MIDRWPLKPEARILGIDDGPYHRDSSETPIVMTVMRADGYIEGIMTISISTDGRDSASRIIDAVNESRFKEQIRAILSDGACLAGFNVLDIGLLNSELKVPVITCSDREPDGNAMESALRENFPDWKEKLEIIRKWDPVQVDLKDGPSFIRYEGTTDERAKWLVRKMTIRGRTPEPIRISHLVASAVFR